MAIPEILTIGKIGSNAESQTASVITSSRLTKPAVSNVVKQGQTGWNEDFENQDMACHTPNAED